MARPSVSVVVPTRDRPEMLARCLASISESLDQGDELIVVDSASRDAGAVAAVVTEAGARLVRCELPGVCRARNAGWRAATRSSVVFADDDVTVDRGWATAFATVLEAHPEVSFLTGRIEVPAGQDAPVRPIATKGDLEAAVLDGNSSGDLGHSASLAVRRDALEAIGGFDESLGTGGRFRAVPEYDLFDRMFLSGRTGRYEPTALAFHDQWRSEQQAARLDFSYGFGNGARLAKLARADRSRMKHVLGDALGPWGFGELRKRLRHRQLWAALGVVARLTGTMLGFVRGMLTPVDGGHYRARR